MRRRKHFLRLVLVLLLVGVALPAVVGTTSQTPEAGASTSTTTSYIHDADGRLLAVVEPAGDAYVYSYDGAGNITSITHQPAQLSVLRISPTSAAPGQTLHIYGTGFSASASQDQVTIGGSATSTPTVVSPVELNVPVPVGSTGGTVKVTVSSSTATAPASLSILGPPPTISAVTAQSPAQAGTLVVYAGSTLTVTGTGFVTDPTEDRVMIGQVLGHVTATSTTSLTVALPAHSSFSGTVSVTTPSGTASGPLVYTLPDSDTGTTFAGFGGVSEVTSGQTTTLNMAQTNEAGLLLINAQYEQRISVVLGAGTVSSGEVELFAPGGQPVLNPNIPAGGANVDGQADFTSSGGTAFVETVPRSGTYLLMVTPDSGASGSVPVTTTLFSDQSSTITPNGPSVTASVTAALHRSLYSFYVSTPEAVTVSYSDNTFVNENGYEDYLYLTDRSGQPFGPEGGFSGQYSTDLSGASGGFTTDLLEPGPYNVVLDPTVSGDTGSVSVSLATMTPSTIAVGSPVTATVSNAGQEDFYTFSGTAGQRVDLDISNSTFDSLSVTALDPEDQQLDSTTVGTGSGYYLYIPQLTLTGTYQLVLNPNGGAGSATLNLISPTNVTGAITPNGPPVTATLTTPGQQALYSFSGTAGQQISAVVSNSTLAGLGSGSTEIELLDPTGTNIDESPLYGSTGYLPTATLASTGTYQLVIDGSQSGAVGSATVQLYSLTDVTGTITPNTTSSATFTVPGQTATYSFTGTKGQRVSLSVTNSTLSGPSSTESPYTTLTLLSSGTDLSQSTFTGTSGFLPTATLSANGTYQVEIDPSSFGGVGTVNFEVHAFADQTAKITPNGSSVTATISIPGQRVLYSFKGKQGQEVDVDVTSSTFSSPESYVQLLAPNGQSTGYETSLGYGSTILGPVPLTAKGTYQVDVDTSQSGDVGSATLKLLSFSPVTGKITPNGPAVTATITHPGQEALYTFKVKKPTTATVNWSNSTFNNYFDYLELVNSKGDVLNYAELTSPSGSLTTELGKGTYQVVVDPSYTLDTGSITLALTTAPGAAVAGGTVVANPTPAGLRREKAAAASLARNLQALHRRQTAHPGDSAPAQTSRALRASVPVHDITLTGITRQSNGQALRGVTLSVNGHSARSNDVGRFTITGLSPGRDYLDIDGSTAKPNGGWGFYHEVVNLVAGYPNYVPNVIYLTPLDTADAVSIPYPMTKPMVVTTPKIPGLKLLLPAGTVIRNRNGSIVHQISITPISTQTPPFPLPIDAILPTYFTIQPGGATIEGPGAQLIYPNWGHQAPGSKMTFWSYGKPWNGWWVYGHGTVNANGTAVMPDSGTRLHDFSGAMFNSGPTPPSKAPGPSYGSEGEDPVDLSSGLFTYSETDISLPDTIPLSLTRTYRQGDPSTYAFGVGMNDEYHINLWSTGVATLGTVDGAYTDVALVLPDGTQIPYNRSVPDASWNDAEFSEDNVPGPFFGSFITWDGNGWHLTMVDGTTYVFGNEAPLQNIVDRYGDTVTVNYANDVTSYTSGPISDVTSPNGRWLQYSYNESGTVSSVVDNSGRTVSYGYNSANQLDSVTDVRGNTESYTYDANGNMSSAVDARGNTEFTNTYDSDGLVAAQAIGSSTETYSYTENAAGQITQTQLTDPHGAVDTVTFNAHQEPINETLGSGSALEQTTSFVYDPNTNELTSETDPLGRTTTYAYDSIGDMTGMTELAGTPEASTVTATYDTSGRPTSTTDPLGNTGYYAYTDTPTSTIAVYTDPTGRTTQEVTNDGELQSLTDGAGDTTTLTYDGGDLVGVTNPENETSTAFIDTEGLERSVTNPSGATTTTSYDLAGDPTSSTDALGVVTSATYDVDGDLTSFTDGDGHKTTYGYDTLDRLVSVTDPLGATQTYGYDAAGDLSTSTDPDGTTSTATYNLLDELSAIDWGATANSPASTTTYSYDAAGRLTSAANTTESTDTLTYDGLNDVISDAQPQGTVSYTYNLAGEATSMTAGSASPVSYTYDADGRPTSVTTGSSTASLSYDSAGRLSTVNYPGGLTESYTYDPDSLITGISTTGSQPVTSSYTYDEDGLMSGETTDGVTPVAPTAVSSATYNADNELTNWGDVALTYDADGNLLTDGTTGNSYTWDAQGSLTGVTGPSGSTTVAYDPFGRQSSVSTAAGTTAYLHNGSEPALTTTSSGATSYVANPLGGQVYLETSPAGTDSITSDTLGSTTGVYNSSGTVLSQISYTPSGQPTVSNPGASTNDIGFAGYEDAIGGLDNTAAREYDPSTERFISQDPSGLSGGQNAYAYAGDDPLDYNDPTGLYPGGFTPSFPLPNLLNLDPGDPAVQTIQNQMTPEIQNNPGTQYVIGHENIVNQYSAKDIAKLLDGHYKAGSPIIFLSCNSVQKAHDTAKELNAPWGQGQAGYRNPGGSITIPIFNQPITINWPGFVEQGPSTPPGTPTFQILNPLNWSQPLTNQAGQPLNIVVPWAAQQ